MKSVTLDVLEKIIRESELKLSPELKSIWNDIKIDPEKWSESSNNQNTNSFWVVAILGNEVIWYNDITRGFNISEYRLPGEILEYWDEETNLHDLLWHIL